MSRKEAQQKDLAAVMAKEIGGKNPIFSADSIAELHSMFSLYADPRQRKADIRDILMTAKTLGLDRYELVYRVVEEIGDAYGGDPLDFETFLRELTQRIVNFILFREILSLKRDADPTLLFWTPKEKANSILTT